jgi:hypothetical protein
MSASLSPLELRLERFKRLSNARLDFLKRLGDSRTLAEQYLNGDGGFHLHMLFGGAAWCAKYMSCCALDGSGNYNNARLNIHKTIVFVEVAKVSKISNPLASFVWLQPLDDCHMSVADALEVGISLSIKSLSFAFNGELSSRWSFVGVEECESVDEIIERTAKVVASLSNENGDFWRDGNCRALSYPRSYYNIVRRIGIKLGYESISVFFREDIQPLPQINKVFLCPCYTKEAAFKAVTGCGSLHG